MFMYVYIIMAVTPGGSTFKFYNYNELITLYNINILSINSIRSIEAKLRKLQVVSTCLFF